MDLWEYSGPVYEFDICVNENWTGRTRAVSAAKAKSNLIYQYKKQTGRSKDSRISLRGKLHIVEEE